MRLNTSFGTIVPDTVMKQELSDSLKYGDTSYELRSMTKRGTQRSLTRTLHSAQVSRPMVTFSIACLVGQFTDIRSDLRMNKKRA